MITLELDEDEAAAFIVMVERASEEFSNHGCNDFNVALELALGPDEAAMVASKLRRAMVDADAIDADYAEQTGAYIEDWMLLDLLAHRLRTALEGSE